MTDAREIIYSPATATDWDADVGEVDECLDELAGRMDIAEGSAVARAGASAAVSTATSAATIALDELTALGHKSSAFSVGSDVLTVSAAGRYTIEMTAVIGAEKRAPFEAEAWVEADTGSGYSAIGYSKATGGVSRSGNVTSVSTAYTATLDDTVILVDASSAAVTVTLPAVANAGTAWRCYVKKTDTSANAVTIDGSGAETIDGSATRVLSSPYDSVTLANDATEWWIL